MAWKSGVERLAGANKTEAEIPVGWGRDRKRDTAKTKRAPLFLSRMPLGWMVLDIPSFSSNFFFCRERTKTDCQRCSGFLWCRRPTSFRPIAFLFSFEAVERAVFGRPLLFAPFVHSFPALYLSLNERNPIFYSLPLLILSGFLLLLFSFLFFLFFFFLWSSYRARTRRMF